MVITSKRERRFPWRMQHVPLDQQDAKWQCETCSSVTETPESRWCLSCRMYWEDCRNGLWADAAE